MRNCSLRFRAPLCYAFDACVRLGNEQGFSYAYFSSRLAPEPAREGLWRVLCQYLQKEVAADSKVLELGGGYCGFINNIKASEKHVVDLYPEIRSLAAKDVIAHVHSCASLDEFAGGAFDVVFASNLFEHLTEQEMDASLSEARRVLRDGGSLIVIQPNFKYCMAQYFDDYTHRRVFTHTGLCDLLQASGFSVRKVVARFLPFSIRSRRPQWPWLLKLYLRSPWRPFAGQMYIVAAKRGPNERPGPDRFQTGRSHSGVEMQ